MLLSRLLGGGVMLPGDVLRLVEAVLSTLVIVLKAVKNQASTTPGLQNKHLRWGHVPLPPRALLYLCIVSAKVTNKSVSNFNVSGVCMKTT